MFIVSPAYPTFSQFFSQGNKPGKTQLLIFWDFWVIPNHPEVHLLRHLLWGALFIKNHRPSEKHMWIMWGMGLITYHDHIFLGHQHPFTSYENHPWQRQGSLPKQQWSWQPESKLVTWAGKCHGHGFGDGEHHPQNSDDGVDMETRGKQWIPYVMDDVKVCCFQASQHDRRVWFISVVHPTASASPRLDQLHGFDLEQLSNDD